MTAEFQGAAVAASAANKVTASGVGVTVLGWTTSSDFGVWAGILIGLVGLAVNFYYKRKSDKRAAEAHRAYMHENAKRIQATEKPPVEHHESGL